MQNRLAHLDWDNLRLLLALAEAGSLRAAAIRAEVALNTMRSKIDQLEKMFGGALIERSVEGAKLTAKGERVVQVARKVESLVHGADSVVG
jgi:molybdate transport repressor ModE-like protein